MSTLLIVSCKNPSSRPADGVPVIKSLRTSKLRYLFLLLSAVMLGGCSTVGYYSQAVGGHLKLMSKRQSIESILADESTDEDLRYKLETLISARQFAITELSLPANESYSTYVETGKAAVTWNVVATTEFSLAPVTWCFPIAGCVNYRGYYDRQDAEHFAAALAEEKHDVTVGGAAAYSTLGWFDDPVYDTMLRGEDIRYVGTLFHELAHQLLYIKDDSNFNEAFASFVEQEGVRIWLEGREQADRIAGYEASLQRAADFGDLLKKGRKSLLDVYAKEIPDDEKRSQKKAAFELMREDYEVLKSSQWDGYAGYDGWFRRGLNNARLVAVATYRQYVPAFAAMYEEAGRDLARFYALAEEVSELPAEQRRARIQQYLDAAAST